MGSGGTLVIDTVLGDDSSLTDLLVINGNASGTTRLQVNVVGGAGAQTVQGIKVVQVNGTSTNTAFTLANVAPLEAGAFVYALAFRDPGNIGDQNWYLRSTGAVGSVGSLYESAPGVLLSFADLPTLDQRVGQHQWWGRDAAVGALQPTEGGWVRALGDTSTVTPTPADERLDIAI